MIKFFRHIRKSLLLENKTSKYFKYAIGEIILVVIGILIALQINNWNEARKLNIRETTYLKGLKTDFEKSKSALSRVITKTDRVAKIVDTFTTMIKKRGVELTSLEIDSLSEGSSGFTVFMPSEGVMNDIIGSGKLDMITNIKLRNKVASWEADLKMIREFENLSKSASSKYLEQSSQYYDVINFKFNKPVFLNEKREQFLNDNIMTNYLARIFGNSMSLNRLYKEKSNEIDSLIIIIEKELQ